MTRAVQINPRVLSWARETAGFAPEAAPLELGLESLAKAAIAEKFVQAAEGHRITRTYSRFQHQAGSGAAAQESGALRRALHVARTAEDRCVDLTPLPIEAEEELAEADAE